MLVKTRVAPSTIHGMGLFAVEAIPCGTPIWRFEAGFDREFTPEQFAALPPDARAHVRWFAFLDLKSSSWVLSGDHSCFMNHSADPNTGAPNDATRPVVTTALRDIGAGEELTCNYRDFDGEAGTKLGKATED